MLRRRSPRLVPGAARSLAAGAGRPPALAPPIVAVLLLAVAAAVSIFAPASIAAPACGPELPSPFAAPTPELRYHTYLPVAANSLYRCPDSSPNQYAAIPYEGLPSDRPAERHADLNLALRGYERVTAPLQLVDYTGGTDALAPQMPGIFAAARAPQFVAAYQVYSWNWDCGPDGCRGPLLAVWPTTLLGLRSLPGEAVRPPSRGVEIYGGGFVALVLYAAPGRITLKYTREDNVVSGYTVHLENVCVDPNLLALYNSLNSAGRLQLPALHNYETLGTAAGRELGVAVRDAGDFLDPRSRKDWWRGY